MTMLRTLGLALGLLACAPARATTPPVDRPLAATAEPGRVRSDAKAGEASPQPDDATGPIPITQDTSIDVGSGQSLRLRTDGTVLLGDRVIDHGSTSSDAVAYQAVITRDDVTLIVGLGKGEAAQADVYRVTKVDLNEERVLWHVLLQPHRTWGETRTAWRMLTARNRLLIVEDHRVVAIDARTGAQSWAYLTFAPNFARNYFSTILLERRTLHIEHARVRGRELVIGARIGDDRDASMIEIDVDSGHRVYVDARRDAPTPTLLSEFAKPVIEHRVSYDDRQETPPIPLKVEGYDGVAIGVTLLLWNERSARGLIVNPLQETLGEVLAQAQAVRVADASGKQVPITWTAVIDTVAIADSVALARSKPPIARKPAAVQFDCWGATVDSGELVDAESLARSLGTRAITNQADRPKEIGLALVREPDAYTTVLVSWGPFAFEDVNRPATATHVTAL
jgi:hypothetical protein